MMKTLKQMIALSFLLMTAMSSCKKSTLTTYNTADNIYFNYFRDVNPEQQELGFPADTADLTFAYQAPEVTSIILPIPVAVTGVPAAADREFSLSVDPLSTATAQHFELPQTFIFHGGRVLDTIFLKLKRAPDLKTKGVKAIFHLNANKDFATELKVRYLDRGASSADTIKLLSFQVTVSDILAPGPSWGNVYFGTFSEKKVSLLNQIAGMPLDFWSVANTITDIKQRNALASYYAAFMSRYLQDQVLAGNTVYEADGTTTMMMGAAYR
ncbi:DUF4843 domain-containing protein [Pedobacter sp. BAL39]|uniref:DUF4843 domain-containing protein n=1 Tax=Pedobacter sp. BAL39 TaxID=391596 RepID=UPI0012F7491C|nr:DUF4843 domain-containing protein [Pedobacter sp. BAL39]